MPRFSLAQIEPDAWLALMASHWLPPLLAQIVGLLPRERHLVLDHRYLQVTFFPLRERPCARDTELVLLATPPLLMDTAIRLIIALWLTWLE